MPGALHAISHLILPPHGSTRDRLWLFSCTKVAQSVSGECKPSDSFRPSSVWSDCRDSLQAPCYLAHVLPSTLHPVAGAISLKCTSDCAPALLKIFPKFPHRVFRMKPKPFILMICCPPTSFSSCRGHCRLPTSQPFCTICGYPMIPHFPLTSCLRVGSAWYPPTFPSPVAHTPFLPTCSGLSPSVLSIAFMHFS